MAAAAAENADASSMEKAGDDQISAAAAAAADDAGQEPAKQAMRLDDPDWAAAHKRYLWKLDLTILPMISCLYFFEYLDRGNAAVSCGPLFLPFSSPAVSVAVENSHSYSRLGLSCTRVYVLNTERTRPMRRTPNCTASPAAMTRPTTAWGRAPSPSRRWSGSRSS